MSELVPGDIAPDFDIAVSGGGTVSLRGFSGRPVVLYFYPKDDTPACTSQALAFTQLLPQFEEMGAVVIGVSPDSVRKHDKFARKHHLSIILASDEDTALAVRYGVWKEKTMYGRSYMGVERTTFLIDTAGRIARVWSRVKVKDHAEDVLATLKTLSAEG